MSELVGNHIAGFPMSQLIYYTNVSGTISQPPGVGEASPGGVLPLLTYLQGGATRLCTEGAGLGHELCRDVTT